MELIDRYLNAIRRNLPRDRAHDITAELRDVIASHVEACEEGLGRALSPDEVKNFLKEFGHPLVVAARYRSQQYLIGPDAFPFYLSVLRIVLSVVAIALGVAAVANILFNHMSVLHALAQAVGSLWISALTSSAIVTIVFAVLERNGFPTDHVRDWNPAELPDVEDRQPGPWESAIEVAFSIVLLTWWGGLVRLPFSAGGSNFRIEAAPIFTTLYWPIFALIAARLVHNLVQWLRPRWRRMRVALAALTTVGGLILLAILYRAGQWATIVSTGMDAQQAAALQGSLNLVIKIVIAVTAIIWTLQFFQALYRVSRTAPLRPLLA
jgi:hypothetical protein